MRALLQHSGHTYGYNLVWLQLLLNSFVGPRVLTWQGVVAKPLYVARVVVAGDKSVTTLIRLFYNELWDGWCLRHPRLQLDIYIDDATIGKRGKLAMLAEEVVAGVRGMEKGVENGVGM